MGVLIDTDVLIEYERGRLNLEPHLVQRGQEEFFLSVVTASEHPPRKCIARRTRQIRMKRSAFVEALLERFPLLPVDLATARVHAQVWAELAQAGKLIGPKMSLWIAATALARGLAVVTVNAREFDRVPGLVVESWT